MSRWIADRPDVPPGLNPSDLILVRTDEERAQIIEGIDLWVAAEEGRDRAVDIANEDADFADEWDDADSNRFQDRVDAGLAPEDSDG